MPLSAASSQRWGLKASGVRINLGSQLIKRKQEFDMAT